MLHGHVDQLNLKSATRRDRLSVFHADNVHDPQGSHQHMRNVLPGAIDWAALLPEVPAGMRALRCGLLNRAG